MSCVCVVAVMSGCSATVGGDGRSLSQHNDDLRRSNQELRKQLDQTQVKIVLLEGELKSHRDRAASDAPGAVPPGAVVPVLSGLEFARYTGPIDTDRDGADDEVRLFLRPLDQRGRMLVVAGRVNVQVVELRADAQPRVIVDRTFSPAELDGAYRTGLTGDHFSLVLPLSAGDAGDAEQVTVRATLTEAGTGVEVAVQEAFGLAR